MIPVDDLPKTIRVGPHDIVIAELTEEEAKEDYGHFKPIELKIGVCKEFVAGSMAVDTVLHEVLHAIWFVALRESAQEEQICTNLATQLTQVFRDNPELIRWIQSTVTR